MEILPLTGIGEVRAGDDLAAVLGGALARLGLAVRPGDVLVVAQKIVSKAEGRLVALAGVEPGAEALALAAQTGKDPRVVELILAESTAIVRQVPGLLIVRHRLGLVMANAGIDRSNAGGGDHALLLPEDPDGSAARLAAGLGCAVVISDSFGRPWRLGVVNVAIGAAGIPAWVDRRGEADRDGRRLEATEVATGDLIASAAGLVMGEGSEGIPAALVRGCPLHGPERPARALVRPARQDLFA